MNKRYERIGLWAACLFAGIITMRELSYHVVPGLDETYRWALNYFLGNNKEILSQLTYTYGPLCILKWPVAIGDHILIASLFNILLNAVFCYVVVMLYRKARQTGSVIKPLLLAIAYLLMVGMDYVLLGIVVTCLVYLEYTDKKWPLWLALVFTVAGVYIKTSLLALLGATWFVYVLGALIRKQYKQVLITTVAGLAVYFLLGILLFHSAGAAWQYGINNITMALEYSDALNMFPANNVSYLAVSISSLGVIMVLTRKQRSGYVMLLLSVCMFANWKYAVGYEDFWHAVTFLYVVELAFILVLIVGDKRLLLTGMLFLLSISTYSYNLHNLVHYRAGFMGLPDLKLFNELVLHHKESKKRIWQESLQACEVNRLPAEWLQEIGSSTVDILPYDLSIAMINNLDYRPRPTMQTGLPGPAYDRHDAEFIRTGAAAEYLIWHTVSAGKTNIDGINNDYLPDTNPLTFDAILQHYYPLDLPHERFTLWKRKTLPVKQKKVLKTIKVRWNEWIDIPPVDSGYLLRAATGIQPTFKYKLRSAMYKGLPVYIEYQTTDDRIYKYRFSSAHAANGLLMQPFFTGHDLSYKQVARVRLTHQRQGAGYYHDEVELSMFMVAYHRGK